MKKLQLALTAVLLATSSVAMAQNPQQTGAGRGAGGRMMAALMEGITLSPDQQMKLDSISRKYAQSRRSLMQDEGMDQEARRAKGRELMMKQVEEIKAILTEEQKVMFAKNRSEMEARRPPNG